jgi:phosphoribosylanthranilate isomerase
MMKLKVCGITSVAQLQELQLMGVDYAGLIFYERSKRFARLKLSADAALIQAIPIKKIGVFVNETKEQVLQTIRNFGLWGVQLHGDESPEFCRTLMDTTRVIKVFRMTGEEDVDRMLSTFQDAAHYFLFDTHTTDYGGSGKQFNWNMLEKAGIGKPFFLSGGIGLKDAGQVKNFHHPFFHAVDVNSRFESSPGIKDLDAVEKMKTELSAQGA